MPKLLTQPITQIQRPGVVMLVEQYQAGGICVPAGFLYDGASIPRAAWSIIGLSPFSEIIGPATIHDFLYVNAGWYGDMPQHRLTKAETDKLFRSLCRDAGIAKWRSEAVYQAVRLFGRGAFKTERIAMLDIVSNEFLIDLGHTLATRYTIALGVVVWLINKLVARTATTVDDEIWAEVKEIFGPKQIKDPNKKG